jgi:hypothetical protein
MPQLMVYSLSSLTVTTLCEQVETADLEVATEPALADTAAVTLVDTEAATAAMEVETAVASEAELEAVSEVEMTVSIIYAHLPSFGP